MQNIHDCIKYLRESTFIIIGVATAKLLLQSGPV